MRMCVYVCVIVEVTIYILSAKLCFHQLVIVLIFLLRFSCGYSSRTEKNKFSVY